MLALGEKLVDELKLVDTTNTLARWMAHYVAELIVRAKSAPAAERAQAEHECAQAILDLWAEAAAFPRSQGPFDSVDRVIDALHSLGPDGLPRYHNAVWRALEARRGAEDDQIGRLLETASGIDRTARALIHHVLAMASHVAGRESAEWLELARQLDEEDPLTELRIRLVRAGMQRTSLEEHPVAELESRLAQLEQFAATADALRRELVAALETAKAKVRDLPKESP